MNIKVHKNFISLCECEILITKFNTDVRIIRFSYFCGEHFSNAVNVQFNLFNAVTRVS